MPRYVIQLSYDGTEFFGWQKQPDARTVQGTLEQALQTLLQEDISLYGSGRTDTGVHAEEQFAHFDVHIPVEADWVVERLRRMLPDDLLVQMVREVPEHFHARFDAHWRQYRYQLLTGPDPFRRRHAWYPGEVADWQSVDNGLQLLAGEHDFAGFSRKTDDLPHSRCTVLLAEREVTSDGLVVVRIRANRFLRSMMRALTGALISVGQGRKDPEWFEEQLKNGRELDNIPLAPPNGLFLEKVFYPESVLGLT
jgi:tRNA pseudouridine38-40 synthase